MMKPEVILSLIFSLVLLAGCSGRPAGAPPPHFGNSVRQNIAAQVVNPDALYEQQEGDLDHQGIRSTVAQQRYLTDKVEKPTATTTSSVQGSGGGE